MDFDARNPRHLAAVFLLAISIILLIVLPIFEYFQPFPSSSVNQNYSGTAGLIFEIYLVLFSLLFVFFLMVAIPIIWYILVNRLKIFESLHRMNLHSKGLGMAVLWGIVTVIAALALSVALDLVVAQVLGLDTTKLSNIPQLQEVYPLPVLLIIITVQPIAEEIFFRGFILEKVSGLAGPTIGIIVSAALFGIAHLSYGMGYTAVIAGGLGLVFAIAVVRTKNLYTSITAHIIVNVTAITLFLYGKSIGV
jgi:membrane protease YdiL (CAAX protease family)